MSSLKNPLSIWAGSLPLLLSLASCSPKGPAPNTPAFYWQAARETFAAADYLKTTEHLRRVIRSENEFTQRALPWRLVVSSAIAQANIDLADDCQAGLRADPQSETAMRLALMKYRREAETRSLEFAESFIMFRKAYEGQTVNLEFPFPALKTADILERGKVQGGALPSAEVMATVEKRMIERAIAESAAAAAGAPGDIAKGRLAFESGRAETPRETFMGAMLQSLYKQTALFGREAMGKPDRVAILAEQGVEALKTMENTKENQALAGKFKELLKAAQ
ncbi:MAG: hypothetical protein IT159_14805 [Bryobacterales bacterium]|nr:hypothetical protein [Bryobacterales bacterium]